ncbi:hypothetical protein [Neorhizobium lilium]|nr:hypothetical protein [Neorhizobium lilium]
MLFIPTSALEERTALWAEQEGLIERVPPFWGGFALRGLSR